MNEIALLLAVTTVALLAGCSAWASRRLRHLPRLAMQWGFDGQPTWTAPRWLALSFTPALAALLMVGGALALPPGASDAHTTELALGLMAVSFIAAHLYHLRRLGKSAR